jgi:oxalate decarboxylase
MNHAPQSYFDQDKLSPVRGSWGAPIMGPQNLGLECDNPDMLSSPSTDAGTIPNLKFSYSTARNRLAPGGWAREITIRELPIATTMAGVNMRLQPGGIRELHWHKQAEWAYMIAGRARVTAVDPQGRNFIDDVGAGDLWNFPARIAHSIQGLEEGCEFLLAFDDGNFSENETFLIADWFAHTPRGILAKNFGVAEAAFADIPEDIEHTRWILKGQVPGPVAGDAVTSPAGSTPVKYTYKLSEQEPLKVAGGQVRIVDSAIFPAATTISAALVEVEPGCMREMHWHPNTDEWQYYLSGRGRMTVFAASQKARTFDYQAGDVGAVPFAMGHYVENTGEETLRFLELFRSPYFADVSLNQWMALSPRELVRAHPNLDDATLDALSKTKPVIVRSAAMHPDMPALPYWPEGSVAVLSTMNGSLHAIPVVNVLRAGDREILIALARSRGSLLRIHQDAVVALTLLIEGNHAFTARGRARIVQDTMDGAKAFSAIAIDVAEIDDHRQTSFSVDSGVGLHWNNDAARTALRDHIGLLRKIASTSA